MSDYVTYAPRLRSGDIIWGKCPHCHKVTVRVGGAYGHWYMTDERKCLQKMLTESGPFGRRGEQRNWDVASAARQWVTGGYSEY